MIALGVKLSPVLPGNGDLVAIKNGYGGYIGGERNLVGLRVVTACQSLENFFFEVIDEKRFALRQKESGFYVGGDAQMNGGEIIIGEPIKLINSRRESENFNFQIMSNGMIAISNSKGATFSKKGEFLVWNKGVTMAEAWTFEIIRSANPPVSANGLHLTSSVLISDAVFSKQADSKVQQTNRLIPPTGTVVALQSRTGGFVGKFRGKGEKLGMVPKVQDWEKFIIEAKKNGKWAFRQVVSGLYIGGTCFKGQNVALTNVCETCEQFELEARDSVWLGIKSHSGMYMKHDNDKVVWQDVCLTGEHWRLVPDASTLPAKQAMYPGCKG